MNEDHDFALRRVGLEVCEHLGSSASVVGFKFLGQFAGDAGASGWIDVSKDFQRGNDPVWGLEKNAGFARFEGGGEGAAAFAGFH